MSNIKHFRAVGAGNITAALIKDSITESGIRLRTFELEYPRMIHAEVMTHRMASKNSSSTRAIPVERMIELVKQKPATPIYWGENNAGMSSKRELEGFKLTAAKQLWESITESVIASVRVLSSKTGINAHKQIAGRWLETASFIKVVFTATDMNNFYFLRNHPAAQPEIQELARVMLEAEAASTPTLLKAGEWHLPYVEVVDGKYMVGDTEVDLDTALKVSASCCAQASYRKLDDSIEKANDVFSKLNIGTDTGEPAHASPTEHQGMVMHGTNEPFNPDTWEPGITHVRRDGSLWSGNLRGYIQYRQLINNESVSG